MVFCCFDPLSPEEQLSSNEIVSHQKDSSRSAHVENETIVSFITIPPGVSGGQMLRIKSPDGTREIEAQVPAGMQAGQAFLVKFPERSSGLVRAESMNPDEHSGGIVQKLDKWLTPTPDPDVYQAIPIQESNARSKKWTVTAKPLQQVEGEPVQATVTRAQVRENPSTTESRQPPEQDVSFTKSIDNWLTPTPDPDVIPPRQKSVSKTDVQSREEPEAIESRDMHEASRTTEEKVALTKSLEDWLTPTPDPDVAPHQPSNTYDKIKNQTSAAESRELPEDSNMEKSPSFAKSLEDWLTPTPDPDVVPPKEESPPEQAPQTTAAAQSKQQLLLVNVPPGMAAGTTMYVEVPNENRTLAVQVPPNTRSFHVAYTPRGLRAAPPPHAQGTAVHRQTAPTQKLLLVRVPPGTKVGTTLHVSVPDEPGRILAAKVPSGNVKEFHVTYKPRVQEHENRSMLRPASAYAYDNRKDPEMYEF